ncbi:MAG: pilus assembly protein [Chlorobiaceae bacterium]|nr:pilus assembly protein [Chlorobiaceae bacterium]
MITMRTDVAMLQAPTTEHAQSQKGSVLVEFALILPVFLALLIGVIFFSIALYNKTVLTMATREGARAGSKYVANRTNTSIKSSATTAVTNACQNNLISFGTAMTPTITFNADPISDNNITVTASGNYTGFYIFSGLSISARTTMRLE